MRVSVAQLEGEVETQIGRDWKRYEAEGVRLFGANRRM